eukprot:1565961-Amphidinium_carterae.1
MASCLAVTVTSHTLNTHIHSEHRLDVIPQSVQLVQGMSIMAPPARRVELLDGKFVWHNSSTLNLWARGWVYTKSSPRAESHDFSRHCRGCPALACLNFAVQIVEEVEEGSKLQQSGSLRRADACLVK